MEIYPDKINLDELFDKEREQGKQRENIYRKILNRVHVQIKTTSRQKNSSKFTFFAIPEFLVGTPTYDVSRCTAYIIDKLKENGFFVKYTHPNLLFISWVHHLDKTKRAEIKKMYGINVDSNGNRLEYSSPESNTLKESGNIDNMLLVTKNIKVGKKYNDPTTYKPTGNLIYNTALLQTIEDKTS
jgi:hypothetical protein